jgi:hypothetical protein
MKRIKMMGLCLVAVFAMSVVASSVASAVTYEQPVFYGKAAVGSTVGTVGFTGTLTEASLETASKSVVKCTGGTAAGEVTGPTTTVNNTTTFTGCTLSGFACESGATAGVIKTEVLKGTLGQIATSGKVGLRLFNEAEGAGKHPGHHLAKFSCDGGATPVDVTGSVIGELSGAAGGLTGGTGVKEGKFGTTMKLTFAQTLSKQAIQKFDTAEAAEQLESSLKGAEYEKSGQKVTATLTTVPIAGNLGATK